MAQNEDKNSKGEIKVVGDLDEEVVRLDAPKRRPLEKKGKMAAEVLKPVAEAMRGNSTDDEPGVGSEGGIDDEDQEVKAVPMGWFYLLGVILVGVIIWMVFQIVFSKDIEEPGVGDFVGESGSTEELGVAESLFAAEEHYARTEKVLAGFLAAKTVEERVKFVRHPERVLPLMKAHYESHPFKSYTYQLIYEYATVSLSSQPFMALGVKTEEDGSVPILISDKESGMLVDWESFVCYQPIDPEEYMEKRPTEPVSMRVYASLDSFYVYEFSDESKYVCFQLSFRGTKKVLFGYVEKGSVVAQKFRELYPSGYSNVRKPLILSLRFLEGSKGKRCVAIDDLDSALWAFSVNPDKRKASE